MSQEVPLPEQELLDYAARLAHERRAERIAVHVHFSGLQPGYRRADYLRIATGIFANRIRDFGGKYFTLGNADVVYIARDATVAMLESAVDRVRLLFREDPLARTDGAAAAQPGFCTYYHLDRDYDRFMTSCRERLQEAEAQARHDDFIAQMVVHPEEQEFRAAHCAKLEEWIEQADLAPVIDRQTIATILPGAPPEALFDKIYVSVSALRMATAPQINLTGDRWLFQSLTRRLDRRILAYLQRDAVRHERPFSLNLNVATVLSREFRDFNDLIASNLRKTLVLEFGVIDIFADMGAFMFVRDYLHDYGYRLCLDGVDHLTLPYIDRERLGVDLIKMNGAAEDAAELPPAIIPELRARILGIGQSRMILGRCENRQALQTGQELGFVMFQGREIDRLLAAGKSGPGKMRP